MFTSKYYINPFQSKVSLVGRLGYLWRWWLVVAGGVEGLSLFGWREVIGGEVHVDCRPKSFGLSSNLTVRRSPDNNRRR